MVDDYSVFWFHKGGNPRAYSFWAADSIWARFQVTGDDRLPKDLLPDLVRNYEAWEKSHRDANGLFWQADGNDGMEVSISGGLHPHAQGYRAMINSYMYGDALALAAMADRFNRIFMRGLKQLRDLRRFAPQVVVQNAGQINVGNSQINVGGLPDSQQPAN